MLSTHYLENVAPIRPPIMVAIPFRGGGCVSWCIDSHPTDSGQGEHWEVTVDLETLVVGQQPNITVSPSIRCAHSYHGFLTAGVFTPDIGD